MQVTLFATLRAAAGARQIEVALPEGATVGQLVDAVVTQVPALKPQLLDPEGHLWRHVHVMVNGRDAPYLPNALDTPLRPTDVVTLFPPVGGG